MRRDDDGEVDNVVADEGAAGNAFAIKVVVVVTMRRSCVCLGNEVAGASARSGDARDWYRSQVARSRLCPSKCAAGACPLESEMYRCFGTIERNGVDSVDWKTLDFEATEWMGEERRRAMGDTRRSERLQKPARRWGRGRHQLFVGSEGRS
jgi:hypothetical protein